MNRDWQEKRIKQLFHELGREDEKKAPGFTSVLQAALTRGRSAHRGPRVWRLAAVAATLAVAVAIALMLRANDSTESGPPGDFSTLQRIPNTVVPNGNDDLRHELEALDVLKHRSVLDTLKHRPAIRTAKAQRRGPAPPRQNSSMLISQWKSPTDPLLRIPGDELVKSLPRVPDTSRGITTGSIENPN